MLFHNQLYFTISSREGDSDFFFGISQSINYMTSKLIEITDYDPINLLTQNEVYLNAIQKASISVYNLGFRPLDPNTIHRRDGLLTAVIPRLDQAPFLDRVDAGVHTYIRQKRKQDQTSRMRCSMDPNSEVMKHLAQFQMQNGAENPDEDNDQPKSKSKKNKKKVMKVDPNGEIRAARPTSRMEKEIEMKKQIEEEEKKKNLHKERIAQRFTMFQDGVEMVYDDNGNRVPLHVFEKQRMDKQKEEQNKKKREAEEASKVKKAALAKALSSQKDLWSKSSTHVERQRQQAITEQKEFPYWTPGILPASTITMATEKAALPALLVFQKWPKTGEYEAAAHSMVPGDILITIEHCDHCHQHDEFTHHQADQYAEMAKVVVQAMKDTAQRYALRFFSIVRGIDEVDALKVSKSHANTTIKQVESTKSLGTTHHASSILTLGMGTNSPSRSKSPTGNIDLKDEVAKEERAIEQTLGKLRRSLSFHSFNIAASDFQAVRNEAKVQVLQTHNRHRIGAFEVQVTLCINPFSTSRPKAHHDHSSANATPQRPSSAPSSSSKANNSHSNSKNNAPHASTAESQHAALHNQPRQLIQHVLYSKLYHGTWPSVLKLRERLEVLLDSHGVTRLVSGSTVRSSFNFSAFASNKRPDSAPSATTNPVLMGPLSQIQHHREENMRKIEEQQRRMRRSRKQSMKPIPLEELDIENALQRRAEQESAEASKWQEKALKRITPLEELVAPSFDQRYGLPGAPHNASPEKQNNSNGNDSLNNAQNKQPFQSISAPQLHNNSAENLHAHGDSNKNMNDGNSNASSEKKKVDHHLLVLDPLPDSKEASLTETEMGDLDDEILRTMRAAESEKHKHDWSSDENKTKETEQQQKESEKPAQNPKKSALLSATSSSFSSPDGGTKLAKAKSVSFFKDTTPPSEEVATKSAAAEVKQEALLSPIEKKIARPTMVKPSLRSQPSMKDFVPATNDDDTGSKPNSDSNSPPDGNAILTTKTSNSSLSEHFKQNDTNTLKEALLSIQRMLSNDDDSDEQAQRSRFHDDDEETSHHHLMRSDTFADDPFFQQLEHGGESMSVLRISVNLGEDSQSFGGGEDSHAHPPFFHVYDKPHENKENPNETNNLMRGGVQVGVTEVPRTPK